MVEIKFIFTGSEIARAQRAFKLARPALERTVAFFDTADLGLFSGELAGHGLKFILRARSTSGKKHGKTTLKLRATGKLDDSLQTDDSAGAKREFDFAFGRELLDSYSLDAEQKSEAISNVLAGQRGVKQIFGTDQQTLIKKLASQAFHWTKLRIFGPVSQIQVWEDLAIEGFEQPVTFELWDLPPLGAHSTRQLLELSTRSTVEERAIAVDRILIALKKNGIQPERTATKTQTVLEHFSPGEKAK